jgi:hypothetical protein
VRYWKGSHFLWFLPPSTSKFLSFDPYLFMIHIHSRFVCIHDWYRSEWWADMNCECIGIERWVTQRSLFPDLKLRNLRNEYFSNVVWTLPRESHRALLWAHYRVSRKSCR